MLAGWLAGSLLLVLSALAALCTVALVSGVVL